MTDQTDIRYCEAPTYPAPESMSWRGPDDYRVQLDEDGVTLHPGKRPLEQPDVQRLMDLVADVIRIRGRGHANVPVAPTREQMSAESYDRQVSRAWHEVRGVAERAIENTGIDSF